MSPTPPPSPEGGRPPSADHADVDSRPWWGLGDVWVGLLLSQVMAGLVASVLLQVGDWDTVDEAPLWTTGLLLFGLHGSLAAVAVFAARTKGHGVVRDYALRFASTDVGVGVLTGVLAQLILVPLVTFPVIWLTDTDLEDVSRSATELADRATDPVGVMVLIMAVGVVAPVVEEIFFRGLMLQAFRKRRNMALLEQLLPPSVAPDTASDRWNTRVAIVFSSLLFGATHFQLILIPALTAAGAVFALLAVRYDRLGPAIWAHVAFNGTTLVSLLAF